MAEKADSLSRAYDSVSADEVKEWIYLVLGQSPSDGDLMEILQDGVILCRLSETIMPGSVKYKVSTMPFVMMENIASFLRAASKFGVPEHELFETVDLYELKDPAQVLTTIRALSRQAHKFNSDIPVIGPKLASPNLRKNGPTKAVEIPAWNTAQYGFISGNTEGGPVGGRRDIVPQARKPPPPPPKLMIKSKLQNTPSMKRPPVPKKLNVFGEATDDSVGTSTDKSFGKSSSKKLDNQNINIQLMAHNLKSQGQLASAVDTVEDTDPSIYAYDEVYDSMKEAKRKAYHKDNETEKKPKYMDQLLESKKIRERDRLRAQDVKIKREREQEGDEYQDKDVFITTAYKQQQEELEKAAKIDKDEEEKLSAPKSMKSFHMSILDRQTVEHETAVQLKFVKDPAVSSNNPKSHPSGSQCDNSSDEMENHPQEVLKPGLNMVSAKPPSGHSQVSGASFRDSKQFSTSTRRSNRKSRADETMKILKQYEARKQQSQTKEQDKKEKLLLNVLNSKSNDALSQARERFLARKNMAHLKKSNP